MINLIQGQTFQEKQKKMFPFPGLFIIRQCRLFTTVLLTTWRYTRPHQNHFFLKHPFSSQPCLVCHSVSGFLFPVHISKCLFSTTYFIFHLPIFITGVWIIIFRFFMNDVRCRQSCSNINILLFFWTTISYNFFWKSTDEEFEALPKLGGYCLDDTSSSRSYIP